jgi:sugar phosphate isomerase/epimerase
MKIGAQLYTVRDFAQNTDDLEKTLARVAEIGYREVQVSGTCAYEPAWLAEKLRKYGLSCALTHTAMDKMKQNPAGVCRDHAVFGCNYIGIGSLPGGVNDEKYDAFVQDFLPVAKVFRENGCKLFFHNHHCEFIKCADGEMIFDKIINAFDKDTLNFTLDTYWVQMGGGDVCEWLDKLKGRVECIHLKDLEMVGMEQRMAPIGQGSMNFAKIVKAAEAAGTKYALVEQDNCYGRDPFECLKQSYEYLKSLGLR